MPLGTQSNYTILSSQMARDETILLTKRFLRISKENDLFPISYSDHIFDTFLDKHEKILLK